MSVNSLGYIARFCLKNKAGTNKHPPPPTVSVQSKLKDSEGLAAWLEHRLHSFASCQFVSI